MKREQQVGIKFYDEFQLKIPRREVETIGAIILEHAKEVRPGFQSVIVGGYRRGKLESGDVDVMLSHPDEEATLHTLKLIVDSLVNAGVSITIICCCFLTHLSQIYSNLSNPVHYSTPLRICGQ